MAVWAIVVRVAKVVMVSITTNTYDFGGMNYRMSIKLGLGLIVSVCVVVFRLVGRNDRLGMASVRRRFALDDNEVIGIHLDATLLQWKIGGRIWLKPELDVMSKVDRSNLIYLGSRRLPLRFRCSMHCCSR